MGAWAWAWPWWDRGKFHCPTPTPPQICNRRAEPPPPIRTVSHSIGQIKEGKISLGELTHFPMAPPSPGFILPSFQVWAWNLWHTPHQVCLSRCLATIQNSWPTHTSSVSPGPSVFVPTSSHTPPRGVHTSPLLFILPGKIGDAHWGRPRGENRSPPRSISDRTSWQWGAAETR